MGERKDPAGKGQQVTVSSLCGQSCPHRGEGKSTGDLLRGEQGLLEELVNDSAIGALPLGGTRYTAPLLRLLSNNLALWALLLSLSQASDGSPVESSQFVR